MILTRRNTLTITIILVLSSLFLNISCAVFKGRISTFSEMAESMEYLDLSPLRGRLIVIDPGHGGELPGAVGSGGLAEKDINLRVSLKLKEYLEEAEAEVILTREKDRSLFMSKIDSLRGNDLDYRVRVSNENEADLFISIHHNSNLPLNRKYNAVETYYKMEDSYSSFDAGRLIHKHLALNIKPEMNFLRPGNYYVVRSNERTAVLGEAAYISNPDIEKLLKKDEKADLEAKSYFLGILDYFSYGVPEIEVLYPMHETIIDESLPVIRISAMDDGFGGGIDPQSIRVNIDGRPASIGFEDNIITVIPEKELENRRHTIDVIAANRKGNHSLFHSSEFSVDMPASKIILKNIPDVIPPDFRTDMTITARILDENLNPVRDSTKVDFSLENIPGIQKTKFTLNGVVYFYVRHNSADTLNYSVTANEIEKVGSFIVSELNSPLLTVKVKTTDGDPLGSSSINLNNDQIRYSNTDGRTVFEQLTDDQKFNITAKKDGFYPVKIKGKIGEKESKSVNIEMKPVYEGVMSGITIMIDPENGGLSYGDIGPTGLRASDENYETAFFLKHFLEASGATAVISRDKDEDKTLYSRVRYANRTGARLFISLRYMGNPEIPHDNVSTFAYPSSSNGKRLGRYVIDSFFDLYGERGYGPDESAEYVLQQTACPALIVSLGNIYHPGTEDELYRTVRNRNDAYGVFSAIVRYFARERNDWGMLNGSITDNSGQPVENALVSLNGVFHLQTGKDGLYKFITLEPGEYDIKVDAYGYKSVTGTITINPNKELKRDFRLSTGK